MDLPPNEYKISCYSPVSGLYSPAVKISGGADTNIELPEFTHDIALRISKV